MISINIPLEDISLTAPACRMQIWLQDFYYGLRWYLLTKKYVLMFPPIVV